MLEALDDRPGVVPLEAVQTLLVKEMRAVQQHHLLGGESEEANGAVFLASLQSFDPEFLPVLRQHGLHVLRLLPLLPLDFLLNQPGHVRHERLKQDLRVFNVLINVFDRVQ